MRRCFVILLWLLAMLPTVACRAQSPTIAFDSIDKDFGKITQGVVAGFVFTFRNKGTGILEITSIETSCGCTTALLSEKRIPAGKSGQIEVKIKTADMPGALEKFVHVKTNDPRHPDVTLTAKVTVEPEIDMSDSSIFFENAPKGREVRREVLLTIPAGKSIRILSVETADPRVAVRLEAVPANPAQWKVIAIQKADAKPGYHFGEIFVKTSSFLNPQISIFERGTIVAPGK